MDFSGESQRLADTRKESNLWAACAAACKPFTFIYVYQIPEGHSCGVYRPQRIVSAVCVFASRDTLKSPWRQARSFDYIAVRPIERGESGDSTVRASRGRSSPHGIRNALTRRTRNSRAPSFQGAIRTKIRTRWRSKERKRKKKEREVLGLTTKAKEFSQRARGLVGDEISITKQRLPPRDRARSNLKVGIRERAVKFIRSLSPLRGF